MSNNSNRCLAILSVIAVTGMLLVGVMSSLHFSSFACFNEITVGSTFQEAE